MQSPREAASFMLLKLFEQCHKHAADVVVRYGSGSWK